MTRAQTLVLGILSALACGVFVVIFQIAAREYGSWTRQPLGPTLARPAELQLPATWTASPAPPVPALELPPTQTPPAETATASSPFLACRNLPPVTLLVIGTDVRPGERRYGLTDVMRAVRVDFGGQRVVSLEFPRDLWVHIPGIRDTLRTDHQKLNTAYAYGSPGHGPALLARTLDLNFGLVADHYIVANMNVFAEVVDALGGLDVELPPGGIDGRTDSDRSERLVFPGGMQHLNGEQALTLARLRNVSVFERAENQNLVLCALRKKVERPETILRLPGIIQSFLSNIQTDLSPDQISQLACLGTQMPRSNILFAAFPRELFKPGKAFDEVLGKEVFIWNTDVGLLREYVTRFQAGTWPSASPFEPSESGIHGCE